ncbi:serine hydrolase domain-containing protein [Pseudoalteromonas sp. ZZD1]|uniref:serine hydrolase domain-containing protein n=1 Tax=Pseudoalteromonas sp. ZZD1 TaxID=3139395 RepID=UPI003BA8A8B3
MRLMQIILLLVLPYSVAAKQPDESQLNPSIVVEEFLTVFNSNDVETITKYVDDHFAQQSLNRWQGTGRKRYIGYITNMANLHKQLNLKSTTQSLQNQTLRVTIHVDSNTTGLSYDSVILFDQQHKITNWYLSLNDTFKLADENITELKVTQAIQKLTEKLAKNGFFSGTVLFAKDDKVLFTKAYGLASRRYDVKNNLTTKFQIGSMNKMFTSVSIMQLIEANKLSLDNKLTQYMDRDYFGVGDFDSITIEQLLTHTSGLGDIAGFEAKQSQIRSLQDSLPLYKNIPLNFKPGSQWQYSSTGMRMLGHVIESVAKQDYYAFIQQHIYQKAGMTDSGSFDLDVPIKNTARNYWYSFETNAITENLMKQAVKGGPAGGGYSTVGDLHRFALSLINHQLLNTELTSQATSAKPELHSPNYGYGFSVRGDEGNQIIGHNGAHLGMSAQLNIYRDKGYILAVLGNSPDAAEPIVIAANSLVKQL